MPEDSHIFAILYNISLISANTLPDNTVSVYVEVKKGTTPVAGAQVTAIIVKNTDQKVMEVDFVGQWS